MTFKADTSTISLEFRVDFNRKLINTNVMSLISKDSSNTKLEMLAVFKLL